MKKIFSIIFFVASGSTLFAQSTTVLFWQRIDGNVTAPGTDNPVAGISTGGQPWVTTAGAAAINLTSGAAAFYVRGLVLNGGSNSGTTGGLTSVVGTLVCGAGASSQATFDSPTVSLSTEGNAVFLGNLGTLPATCATPIFLIRTAAGSSGHWIGTGAVLTTLMQ